MLDKIEVGKKYRLSVDHRIVYKVLAMGVKAVLVFNEDTADEFAVSIEHFKKNYEPLPSPESPVVQDDVIFEFEGPAADMGGTPVPMVVNLTKRTFSSGYGTVTFEDSPNTVYLLIEALRQAIARLNPPTTTVEEWPKMFEDYWVADATSGAWALKFTWSGGSTDHCWKERGLIFKTEEEAVQVGQAMAEAAKKMVEGVGK